MRKAAFFDIILLLAVFWPVWALRFAGVNNIGALSMAATGAAGVWILWRRKIQFSAVGLRPIRRKDLTRSFEAAGVIGLNYLIVAPALIAILGPLQPSAAVSDQPQDLAAFFIDIVVFTWLAAAIGEEFAFRGVILERFQTLFGGGAMAGTAAAFAQSVWFGAGHMSQGLTGMALTGVIGLSMALYFLTRAERSLAPLMIAHATVNTANLTIAYFT